MFKFNARELAELGRLLFDVIASSVTLVLFSGGLLFAPHWIKLLADFFGS